MTIRTILALLALAILVAPAAAGDEKKDEKKAEPEVKIASAKEAKHELKMFERDFETVDIDFKLEALSRLSRTVHKDVMKRLVQVMLKDPDPYVRAQAALALGNQTPFKDEIARKIKPLLYDRKTEPMIVVALVKTVGKLEYRKFWERIAKLVNESVIDDIVVACFDVIADWKELRAHREIQNFWNVYPDESRYVTGSVSVDTGAAGDEDQRAAEAAWRGKYGDKTRFRPRPECVQALKRAVKAITGEEITKPPEFREWCKKHKVDIKRAESKRD